MISSVVITGTSSGIGEACALALDAAGWRVFAGVLDAEEGATLKSKAGRLLTPVILDVTDAESIEAARAVVADTLGPDGLAGLVNNAGISVTSPLELVPIDALKNQFEVNVIGPVAVTQAFLPLLRTGNGRIVNMGSAFGWASIPFIGPYSGSKAALERMTDVLRAELTEWGIHVSLIAPGPVATPLWHKSLIAAAHMSRKMSREGRALYGWPASINSLAGPATEGTQVAASDVSRAVCQALMSRYPRNVYAVGPIARNLHVLARLGSRRVRDYLVRRATRPMPVPRA